MRNRPCQSLTLSIVIGVIVSSGPTVAVGQDRRADPAKKILVELYSSQGCDSCPPAADLLGKLTAAGDGGDRIVALNFHVDYFNTPWEDPFSDPSFSVRQQSYNQVMKRTDLYFTPLMMVDGRYPLLGSNRDQAVAALRQARNEPPGVNLGISLDGPDLQKTVTVKLASRTAEVAGRDLLIGVALTQDRASTQVPTGENAGKTLVEYHVVRRLDHKFTKLDRTEPTTLTFAIPLPAGGKPSQFHVAAFAQDRANGKIYQAAATPWTPGPASLSTTNR